MYYAVIAYLAFLLLISLSVLGPKYTSSSDEQRYGDGGRRFGVVIGVKEFISVCPTFGLGDFGDDFIDGKVAWRRSYVVSKCSLIFH